MTTPRRRSVARPGVTAGAAAGLVVLVLTLTGCSGKADATPSGSATPKSSASAPVSSAPTTPPPTQSASGATPVAVDCDSLVPKDVLATFGAGYTPLDADWAPAAGSDSARILDLHGTACRWSDASTGHVLDVAVAQPSAHDLTALKDDLVERSNSVPTYGEEGYFQVVKSVGQVNDFHGKYWIIAQSQDLFEPGDAAPLIQSIDDALDAAD